MNSVVEIYCIKVPDRILNLEFYIQEYLDLEEKIDIGNYKTLYRKYEFLLGRILIKKSLASKLNVSFREIKIKKDKYGKPYLYNYLVNAPIAFNLAHSNGVLVLAISNSQSIGVDVEEVNKQNYLELINTICTSDEEEYIQRSYSSQLKNEKFLFIWTRKEALLKYLCKGFSLDPVKFSVPFHKSIEKKDNLLYYTFYPYDNFISTFVIESKNEDFPIISIDYLKLESSNLVSIKKISCNIQLSP